MAYDESIFLTFQEFHNKIKEHFRAVPDEFMLSPFSAKAKVSYELFDISSYVNLSFSTCKSNLDRGMP